MILIYSMNTIHLLVSHSYIVDPFTL